MALPTKISEPPGRYPITDQSSGLVASTWIQFFDLLFKRVGSSDGWAVAGDIRVFETEIGFGDIPAVLLSARAGDAWKIRDAFLTADGTNFSGGDRNLAIGDGTTVWSVIPAATLQSLANARWGDTALPYPATDMTTASAAAISASYSGGTTDYTAGTCTVVLIAERTA